MVAGKKRNFLKSMVRALTLTVKTIRRIFMKFEHAVARWLRTLVQKFFDDISIELPPGGKTPDRIFAEILSFFE